MSDPLAIKIDVDTHDGMKHGVPRLLDLLAKHRVRATFFLALGPDRMGRALLQLRHPRFLQKMMTTNAPSLYGWRTIFSGTLLPARPVATAFPDLVRRLEAEGHEAAIHAWDHRGWQDDLPRFKTRRIQAHFDRSLEAYRRLTGHDPAGIGAPAWTTTPESILLQDRLPLAYASDLRDSPACRLMTPLGPARLPQFPGTGACLEELLGRGVAGDEALAAGLHAEVMAGRPALRVLTLHAEVEGGPFAGVLDRLLPRLRDQVSVTTMAESAARLSARLPWRDWVRVRLPGRAFPVTSSRARCGDAAPGT